MQEIVEFLPDRASGLLKWGEVAELVDALRNDRPIVLPTETGYMIAASALSDRAVKRVFSAKNRPRTNTIHVAVSSPAEASKYVEWSTLAERLAAKFLPGPLTLVLPSRVSIAPGCTKDGAVGIRVPSSPCTLQVMAAFGVPVTATSLNESGQPAIDVTEAGSLAWDQGPIFVVRDEDSKVFEEPSTLVRVNGSELEVLREGAIDATTVRKASNSLAYTDVSEFT